MQVLFREDVDEFALVATIAVAGKEKTEGVSMLCASDLM